MASINIERGCVWGGVASVACQLATLWPGRAAAAACGGNSWGRAEEVLVRQARAPRPECRTAKSASVAEEEERKVAHTREERRRRPAKKIGKSRVDAG